MNRATIGSFNQPYSPSSASTKQKILRRPQGSLLSHEAAQPVLHFATVAQMVVVCCSVRGARLSERCQMSGLVPPSRVVWGELPCKRPRPPPRGPGTGLPRAQPGRNHTHA